MLLDPPVTRFFPLMSISSLWQNTHLLSAMHTESHSEKKLFPSYLPLSKSYRHMSGLLHSHTCVNTDNNFFSLNTHDVSPASHKHQMSEICILSTIYVYCFDIKCRLQMCSYCGHFSYFFLSAVVSISCAMQKKILRIFILCNNSIIICRST